MANGTLNTATATANTNTVVYTVTASAISASISVIVCNRDSQSVKVRIAVAKADTPKDAEWVIWDASIDPGQSLEQACLIASPGDRIVCYSNSANVSYRAMGFEKLA
jgi:hypothetical protein